MSLSRQVAAADVSKKDMRWPAVLFAFVLLGSGPLSVGEALARSPRGGARTKGHAGALSHSRALAKGKRAADDRDRPARASKSAHGKHAQASHRRDRRSKKRAPAPPPMPTRIEVLSADPESGIVQVLLTGPVRPPHARLFVLTNSRGRRFLPALAECYAQAGGEKEPAADEPSLSRWRCAMTIPDAFRRGDLTGVSMEWGDRIIQALPGQVKARWAAAGGAPLPMPVDARVDDASASTAQGEATPESGPAPGAASATPEKQPGQPAAPTERGPGEGEPEAPESERAEPDDVGPESGCALPRSLVGQPRSLPAKPGLIRDMMGTCSTLRPRCRL